MIGQEELEMSTNNQTDTNDYKEEGILDLTRARNHFWFEHRNRIIEDLVRSFQKEKPSILEFGAGGGNISSFLSDKRYRIVASDFYSSGVKMIERNGIEGFRYDLVDNSPVPEKHSKAYDIVILGDVIEHLEDPVKAMKNARLFLKEGGQIIITVPALSILWTTYDICGGHKRRYSKRMLIEHMRKAGYKAIRVRYFMFLPSIVLLLTRKVNDLFNRYNEGKLNRELEMNSTSNVLMKVFMTAEFLFQKLFYVPFGSSIYGVGESEN